MKRFVLALKSTPVVNVPLGCWPFTFLSGPASFKPTVPYIIQLMQRLWDPLGLLDYDQTNHSTYSRPFLFHLFCLKMLLFYSIMHTVNGYARFWTQNVCIQNSASLQKLYLENTEALQAQLFYHLTVFTLLVEWELKNTPIILHRRKRVPQGT